ncbi:CCA tRNA nucleotidyltransferase [Cyanobium sp. FGCU-52]|nr:CCA tRNA nucleotidyltransferase [Cyanobium sp. FGCU52]
MTRPIPPTVEALPGLPPSLLPLLRAAAGDDRLALVGGAVRDLLLHRVHNDPWLGVPDLDLVVEPAACGGDDAAADEGVAPAQRLAHRLCRAVGPDGVLYLQEHGAYGTVELELQLPEGPLLLDLASARRETYPQPGENPVVSFGRLGEDLARRDFTINAIALQLGGEADGALADPHAGLADLAARRLRFLHGASVRDDPTRVVRGARYAARLGFELADDSRAQIAATLAAWPWAWRPGDPPAQAPPALATRLRTELELLLERESWILALAALQRWGGLLLLDPALQSDRHWRRRLRRAARLGLPLLPALLAVAAEPLAVAERLQLPHRQHRLLMRFLALRQRLAALPPEATGGRQAPGSWTAARWCDLLEEPGAAPEAVALALAAGVGPPRPLLRWWLRWRHLGAGVSAAELMAAEGLRPGPELGRRLRQRRRERLERETT